MEAQSSLPSVIGTSTTRIALLRVSSNPYEVSGFYCTKWHQTCEMKHDIAFCILLNGLAFLLVIFESSIQQVFDDNDCIGISFQDLPTLKVSTWSRRGDLLLGMGSPFGILSPSHFFNRQLLCYCFRQFAHRNKSNMSL